MNDAPDADWPATTLEHFDWIEGSTYPHIELRWSPVKADSSALTTPPGEDVPAGGLDPGCVITTPDPRDAAQVGELPLEPVELLLLELPHAANSTTVAQTTRTIAYLLRADRWIAEIWD